MSERILPNHYANNAILRKSPHNKQTPAIGMNKWQAHASESLSLTKESPRVEWHECMMDRLVETEREKEILFGRDSPPTQ